MEFEETPFPWTGRTVLVDIDGTLLADGEDLLAPETRAAIRRLAAKNRVFLCSNSWRRGRPERIAKAAGVPLTPTRARKPSLRVLRGLPLAPGEKIIVIGDKFLTDFLFAWRAGAEFIAVDRKRSRNESFLTRFAFFVDDAARSCYRWFAWKEKNRSK